MTAYVSAFDLFSIGVGPSSSHTVGPMRAALDFAQRMEACGALGRVARVGCTLYGSLGATGIGHGTPDAVVAGLRGLSPETCDPVHVRSAWTDHLAGEPLRINGHHDVPFVKDDVVFAPRTRLPGHPNAMTLTASDADGAVVAEETYYSVGGGFIRRDGEEAPLSRGGLPYSYADAASLLALCDENGLSIAEVARLNETALRSEEEVAAGLDAIWDAMAECVDAGLHADGVLPGILKVKRRAGTIRAQLEQAEAGGHRELPGEWLGAFALAVNEENAAGGRVVTAPTNGAAGILPAVAMYWWRFLADSGLGEGNAVTPYGELVGSALIGFDPSGSSGPPPRSLSEARSDETKRPDPALVAEANRRRGIRRFLLTATALGSLFKANASISGAEGGCQAEVGSACAMAAGGLTAVMGGTNRQIENAAEIAMEHHLGLTCDPIGGLVQIPCIERNAIAAATAVTAARLALRGDGSHYVSLDAVVETMRQTGADMSTKYKETSEGGLAVNVIEC
ncbi:MULTISPECIES: L-serine ammonia-lyase, iron-sulfur-dependent, subunit alpha [unclassified Microbacterium]|uniref:L-serine ammonia-lyase, iron-sulfur-dependent, subunit alpha n=1 Tax=unclassified Microbacterium TaxID=2609290 RepID=UPI000EA96E2A|nr:MULTISPECIES: L-serine ammonia-lyase, iron-sulfur-dependent, subunit alpha [unclassified Microbacterium]MBT2484662.1 L-serine ammonia-lyase, iron-sulfur-dependent, subunit alpha [Microbacterium sp. ISL-108]RKN69524.1 L-serine ammonia-lyase [Microbacterium sp. CGR2]